MSADADPLDPICDRLFDVWATKALGRLADTLAAFAKGQRPAHEAHTAVIAYGLECERVLRRLTEAKEANPHGLIRDAWDQRILSAEAAAARLGREPGGVAPAGCLDAAPKRAWVEASLGAGPVLVHLDATKASVDVPDALRGPELVLRFGYDLRPAIPDLAIDDWGIRGTLTFRGTPHFCQIPWEAVRATVVDGTSDVQVWDLELADSTLDCGPTDSDLTQAELGAEATSNGKRSSHLRLVP